ncbi:hypothetical protein DFH05DRAFT_1517290 [Lentinula detonsa]|uniref:Uncharacterized protein n=1 Tax=Lentinula detonsa TaxID=2804962 RepID=A0A9W8NQ52_9AGAR|nr:hypothetical protein DFH05DRAFT_1517290 [Lentinula detonsa]
MRGVQSFAMVLCVRDRVYYEGAEFKNATPLTQLNPKKKLFETIQPGFLTFETREAAWVNAVTGSKHRIRTKNGVCVASTLVGCITFIDTGTD